MGAPGDSYRVNDPRIRAVKVESAPDESRQSPPNGNSAPYGANVAKTFHDPQSCDAHAVTIGTQVVAFKRLPGTLAAVTVCEGTTVFGVKFDEPGIVWLMKKDIEFQGRALTHEGPFSTDGALGLLQ